LLALNAQPRNLEIGGESGHKAWFDQLQEARQIAMHNYTTLIEKYFDSNYSNKIQIGNRKCLTK
jgi:hypothetical protein